MHFFLSRSVKSVQTVFQMEGTECGAACLGMILSYFGYYEPLERLRTACGVSRNGSKASLILKAAQEQYHLEGHGFRVSVDDLERQPLPCIIFWDFEHYVVFEGRKGTFYYVNDPAKGKCRYERVEFEKHFTGVVLTFTPTPQFQPHGKPHGVFMTLLPFIGKVKAMASVMLWAGILLIVPGILMPALLQIFIDEVMPMKSAWLYPLLMAYTATAFASAILTWLTQAALRRGEFNLSVNSSLKMLRHMLSLPIEFFSQRNPADLQNRVSLNSEIADAFFSLIAGNIVKIFTASFFLFLMFQLSVALAGVAFGAALLNFVLLSFVNKQRQNLNQGLVTAQIKVLNETMVGISSMESLRACGHDSDFFGKWANKLADFTNRNLSMQRSNMTFTMLPTLLNALNNILILCLGAYFVMEGDLTLGGMMAFQALVSSFMTPVNALVMAGAQIQMLKGNVERVNDVLNYEVEERFAPVGKETPEVSSGKLELRDLSFGYSRLDRPLIENFSFILKPGERIALVGSSGSGKSTVAKIAAGLYAPWSGKILLDDIPIAQYSQEAFNRAVATVDQNIMLFSGSIADNLTLFSKSYDAKELFQALRDADMEETLAERGQALHVEVAEGGTNFSGGQRQRLEIARALARRSPILILDEATSALDPVTEMAIDNAIRRRGCSCLIIAHRLSTIRDCDEIIMMDSGKIIERGTHEILMTKQGTYASLMQTENAKDEEIRHD